MNPQDAAPAEVYQRFAGYEKLTGLFGGWPGFEDAEILSLQLMRQGHEVAAGPTVTTRLRAFEWGQDPESGRTVLDHPCVVTLRFGDVDELHLAGINSQNPIQGLELGVEPYGEPPRLTVLFRSARGLGGSFSCHNAEVVSVRLGEPVAEDFADHA